MEENTPMIDEEFGVDWNAPDGEVTELGNQTEELTETTETVQETAEPSETPAVSTQEPQQNTEGATQEQATQEQTIRVNYMGQEMDIPESEKVAWMQKGLDRDRVVSQRDQLRTQLETANQTLSQNKPVMDQLEALAQATGTDINGLVRAMRVNLMVHNGMSQQAAEQAVVNEDLQRELRTRDERDQAAAREQQTRADQERQAEERKQQDIQNFLAKYPSVDPKTIPASVWNAVHQGESLVSAYGSYENQQLRQQIQEMQTKLAMKNQNEQNQAASVGSVATAGNATEIDKFLAGFDSI